VTDNSTRAPLDPPTNCSKLAVSRSTTLLAETIDARPKRAADSDNVSLILLSVSDESSKEVTRTRHWWLNGFHVGYKSGTNDDVSRGDQPRPLLHCTVASLCRQADDAEGDLLLSGLNTSPRAKSRDLSGGDQQHDRNPSRC
jgi:hypothetical protein